MSLSEDNGFFPLPVMVYKSLLFTGVTVSCKGHPSIMAEDVLPELFMQKYTNKEMQILLHTDYNIITL